MDTEGCQERRLKTMAPGGVLPGTGPDKGMLLFAAAQRGQLRRQAVLPSRTLQERVQPDDLDHIAADAAAAGTLASLPSRVAAAVASDARRAPWPLCLWLPLLLQLLPAGLRLPLSLQLPLHPIQAGPRRIRVLPLPRCY